MRPSVCAVMLTRDRPELAYRAVQCFRAQSYDNKQLLILDTGEQPFELEEDRVYAGQYRIYVERYPELSVCQSIGNLRNLANSFANPQCLDCEILIHWDDDDWSHWSRIEEQVALLEMSGAGVVGYSEMLFARNTEAWLYTSTKPNYALGTSLCYWRKTWEAKKFPNMPFRPGATGEDTDWQRGLPVITIAAFTAIHDPRMIARIHGANSQPYNLEASIAGGSREWTRIPEWDAEVGRILA